MSDQIGSERAQRRIGRVWQAAMLAAAMALPTVATWLYFVVYSGHAAMQAIYAGSKVVQFAIPVVWVLGILRERIVLAKPSRKDLILGVVSGVAIVAAGLLAYFAIFKSGPWLAGASELLRAKLLDMRLLAPGLADGNSGSPARFFAFAAFLSLLHSGLEEYYWRWFVYGQLRRLVPMSGAVLLSSVAFMAHHVIVLDVYLADKLAVAAFSLCIAAGGVIWAVLYERTGSLYGPWISHLLVDAGIMWIGYDLVWNG